MSKFHKKKTNLDLIIIMSCLTQVQRNLLAQFPKDFTFVLDSNKYYCNTYLACIFSPFVSNLLRSDPLLSLITIPIHDPTFLFSKIIDYIYGKQIKISKNSNDFGTFIKIVNFLLIKPLSQSIQQTISSLSDAIKILTCEESQVFSSQIQIDYIATHFYEMTEELIKTLSPFHLEMILQSPLLIIKDENTLFSLLVSHPNISENQHLLKYIYFRELSPDNYSRFISFDFTTQDFLQQIRCSYITHRKVFPQTEKVECLFKKGKSIFSFLWYHYGKNPCEFNAISVTASSQAECLKQTKDIIQQTGIHEFSTFSTRDIKGSYIIFDFRKFSINPQVCKITLTRQCSFYPLEIQILLYDDKKEIISNFIYDIKNQTHCGAEIYLSFNFLKDGLIHPKNHQRLPFDRFCRFILIRQIGTNSGHNYCFQLSKVDFYGVLSLSPPTNPVNNSDVQSLTIPNLNQKKIELYTLS